MEIEQEEILTQESTEHESLKIDDFAKSIMDSIDPEIVRVIAA